MQNFEFWMQVQVVVGTSHGHAGSTLGGSSWWAAECVPRGSLAASVGPRGLLTLQHEGLMQGQEHCSASFATRGVICPVPSESFNLPRTDSCGALLPCFLREKVFSAGEVSFTPKPSCLVIPVGFFKRLQFRHFPYAGAPVTPVPPMPALPPWDTYLLGWASCCEAPPPSPEAVPGPCKISLSCHPEAPCGPPAPCFSEDIALAATSTEKSGWQWLGFLSFLSPCVISVPGCTWPCCWWDCLGLQVMRQGNALLTCLALVTSLSWHVQMCWQSHILPGYYSPLSILYHAFP